MTSTQRPRFSARLGIRDSVDDAPYEGVPAHLRKPLRDWVLSQFRPNHDDVADRICLRMRYEVPANTYAQNFLASMNGWDLLDVIDTMLGYQEYGWSGRDVYGSLERILSEAGSAYRVNEHRDGLEERVPQAVRDAVSETVAAASHSSDVGSAADHLANAWQAAYGLHPDPVRAYSEAIKAAEAAAHSVIEPSNSKATLGSMIRVIRNAPSRFTTSLFTPPGKEPVAAVEGMMRALWEGQTSRHGARTVTVPETLEAARAAVHLAATLVQWFTVGAVARMP